MFQLSESTNFQILNNTVKKLTKTGGPNLDRKTVFKSFLIKHP